MDINYHYFAVKAVASTVGFSEDEAQRIAFYSQYIDDFDKGNYMFFSHVPDYARYLAQDWAGFFLFNPVTTGFSTWYDMVLLAIERHQKWIATPYHFIPEKPSPQQDWRVVPARLNTPSLISGMLKEAQSVFMSEGQANRQTNLMRIGMLLHTFADTYAHQRFNGYNNWSNQSYLENVINNIDQKDVTAQYSPELYDKIIPIGHANVYHAPDDSNVQFFMKQKLDKKDGHYSYKYDRSNTSEFCVVSKEIANYLLSCLGKPPMEMEYWSTLEDKLTLGFLTSTKDHAQLEAHWGGIFKSIAFHYDKNKGQTGKITAVHESVPTELAELMKEYQIESVIHSDYDDDFFRFNVLADKTRVKVNGEPFSDSRFSEFQVKAAAMPDVVSKMRLNVR
jgi:hypothetical protein